MKDRSHSEVATLISALERVVEGRGHEFPDRVDEWRAYLVSLRTVAETDGTLPTNVHGLLQDVFEPLLERRR